MEKKQYTHEQFIELVKLIGQKVHFFVKSAMPHAQEGQMWAYLPLIMPAVGTTTIAGVNAKIEKKATKNGIEDTYYDVQIILRNPWYQISEEEKHYRNSNEPGFPPPVTVNSLELWNFAPDCLGKWFWLHKGDAFQNVHDFTTMYYPHLMK